MGVVNVGERWERVVVVVSYGFDWVHHVSPACIVLYVGDCGLRAL